MDLVTTKCLFSRMNIMRSTLLASMLLRRLPIRWASADKLRSAWQLFWMWVVMPDVPIPLLLPSDGVHFMNEGVAGSPITFLDQARNMCAFDGWGESTQSANTNLSTSSCRNAPVAAADRGFSPAWGLQHHRLTPIHRIVRTRG